MKEQHVQMTGLLQCLQKAKADGYTFSLAVTDHGLTIEGEKQYFSPHEVSVEDYYRFEGASDPDENSILYLIRLDNGKRGVLINSYGAYADPLIASFIEQVEDMNRKSKIS